MYKRYLIAALIPAIAACSGGGSSSLSDAGGGTMSGTAAKGLIDNGIATAYRIDDDCPADDNIESNADCVIGSDVTVNGTYSIDTEGYRGTVLLRIRAQPAPEVTTMVCDFKDGCGGTIGFGDIYELDADFRLDLCLDIDIGETLANPTVLTTAASDLAASRIAGGGPAVNPSDAVAAANSQVANLFGLNGTLPNQGVVDITDPDALAAASAAEIFYSSVGPGTVAAFLKANAGLTLEEAFAKFVADYKGDENDPDNQPGLRGNSADGAITDLKDIFEAVKELLTALPGGSSEAVATAQQSADSGITRAEEIGEESSAGEISDNAASDGLTQAKAMVQDLINLGNGVVFDAIDEDSQSFQQQLQAAGDLLSDDGSTGLVLVTEVVLQTIAAAYEAFLENSDTRSYVANGITVTIAPVGGSERNATLTVDQSVPFEGMSYDADIGVAIEQDYEQEITHTGDNESDCCPGSSGEGTKTGDISADNISMMVSGSVSSEDFRLSFPTVSLSGSGMNHYLDSFSYTNADGVFRKVDNYESETEADSAVSMIIRLEALNDTELTFEGGITFSIIGLEFDETKDNTDEFGNGYEVRTEMRESIGSFDSVEFTLAGSFSNKSGDLFSTSMAITVDGSGFGDITTTINNTYGYDCRGGISCENLNDGSRSQTAESASSFLGASVVINLEMTLPGLLDDVLFTLNATRSQLDAGEVELIVVYEGRRIVTDALITQDEPTELSLLNQNGILMELTIDSDSGDSGTGTIKKGTTTHGNVNDGIVRFSDGTFVSLR